jgi:hypothetical protein
MNPNEFLVTATPWFPLESVAKFAQRFVEEFFLVYI